MCGILGNKCDLFMKEQTNEEEVFKFANEKELMFQLVSAKSGSGLSKFFNEITEKYLNASTTNKEDEDDDDDENNKPTNAKKSVSLKDVQKTSKRTCC